MYLRPFIHGALTYVPGVLELVKRKGTGGSDSAAYCYDVWLKHLTLLWANGLRMIPATLAELGPGDSFGVGLAGMLSGVDHYHAVDAVRFATPARNLEIFDELVELFRRRAPRPTKGWPDFDAYLDEHLFPSHILTPDVLDRALAPERLGRIRRALTEPDGHDESGVSIRYAAPWTDPSIIDRASIDLVVSHAVLQSPEDLDATYGALSAWLRPGGLMSHQIDFTCFRTARAWNGHWSYTERMWRLILGRRKILHNREPHSKHIALLEKHGFDVTLDLQSHRQADGMPRSHLAPRWKDMSDHDFTCAGALIQASRKS